MTSRKEQSTEEVEPSRIEKIRAFVQKITPDKHQKMERTGRTVAVMGGIGVLLMGFMIYSSTENRQTNIDATSVFIQDFKTSKTQNEGSVERMYVSENGDEAMIIFKFADAALVSTQASMYQAFLTAIDTDLELVRLESEPTGEIINFGSTGYMGLVLKNSTGEAFPSQLLSITIRAAEELTIPSDSTNAEVAADISERTMSQKYDQWTLVVNPGADEVERSSLVTDGSLDYRKIYNDLVTAPAEADVKKKMGDTLAQMRTVLASMDDYHARLQAVSIDGSTLRIPDYPNFVESDKVVCADGVDVCDNKDLRLETDFTYGNGYSADWLSGSVGEGYLADLTQGQDPLAYLTDKNNSDSKAGQLPTTSWSLSNDRLLSSYDSSLRPVADAQQLISQWMGAVQQYDKLKRDYQVSQGYEMLNLELNLMDATENTQTYSGPDALRVY